MLWAILFLIPLCGAAASSRLFYIYETGDWPEISTASLYKRDSNERLEHSLYNGAGPLVSKHNGEYHTDQYQLFAMIFNRALKDPRRTLDPSKATSFLIPYDFASDSAFYKSCSKSNGICYDFRKCPLAPKVESLLALSPWLKRNQGRDHVLIVGMNYAMDHYILKPKCKSLIAGICSNCTKFAIDDYSYMYSSDAGILSRGDYWHAVPFPADFHWTKHVQRPFPWENTVRPILVSYIGSVRSFYGPARRVRASIVHYCSLHPDHCLHSSYGLNGTRHSFMVDGHRPLQVSQRSVFCFQPIGDLMTRKGLFDSLLQGCIPVVFDALTASVMYTWHWEEAFWQQVIVEFPMHSVAHRYFDPVEALKTLMKHNASDIARKQALIRERVFQLQYGLDGHTDVFQHDSALPYITLTSPPPPTPSPTAAAQVVSESATGSGVGNSTPTAVAVAEVSAETAAFVYEKRVRPPGGTKGSVEVVENDLNHTWPLDPSPLGRKGLARDAYDIIVDYFLGWHSGDLRRQRNATVPECWDGWLDAAQNRCRPGTAPAAA
jgi:hypothetical protein